MLKIKKTTFYFIYIYKYMKTFEQYINENDSNNITIDNVNLKLLNIIKKIKNDIPEKDKYEYQDFLHENYPEFYDKYGSLHGCEYYNGYLQKNKKYCRNVASSYFNINLLKLIKKYIFKEVPHPKLCDMGCGVGNVMTYTKTFGYDVMGVEMNEELKKYHKDLNVIYGDFFNINLSFLKNIDVVYLYRPIDDNKLADKLMKLIYDNTKKDVIILFADANYDFQHYDVHWKKYWLDPGTIICYKNSY